MKAKNPYEYGSAAFWAFEGWQAARAEALEEAARLCETKEIPFSIHLWAESTKGEMTAHTAIALANEIRALINKEQA